jgi:hypothetical protein
MKQFNGSHLEIKKWFSGNFQTHPYEAGWANEAIFFIMIEHEKGTPQVTAQVQISHDGVHWVNDGSEASTFTGQGLHALKVQPNFGNWLRVNVTVEGGEAFLNIQIHCKG